MFFSIYFNSLFFWLPHPVCGSQPWAWMDVLFHCWALYFLANITQTRLDRESVGDYFQLRMNRTLVLQSIYSTWDRLKINYSVHICFL